MGYESLSTVVVLAIVVILMAVWLPRRTVKGMKRVIEHREDRFSPSLHLVDADSGTRFSDDTVAKAKGVLMQSTQTHAGGMSEERIAQVRSLRRAAIRRRRMIVLSLLAITVVVLVCAFALHFSPLFALIPAALLAVVLALGIRASKQAVAWERKVSRYRSRMRKRAAAERSRAQKEQAERARLDGREPSEDRRNVGDEQTKTDVVSAGEIRQAIDQGKADRDAAVLKRGENAASQADAQRVPTEGDPSATDREVGLSIHDEREDSDGVSEVVRTNASQDLISFSLGAPRDGNDISGDAPESMEIKSTRQVAKAVPVSDGGAGAEPLIVPSGAISAMDSDEAAVRVEEGVHLKEVDVSGFHDAEVRADVEAPDATSDSLGTGLEAILARRSA